MYAQRGIVRLERFIQANTEQKPFWSAQAWLAPFLLKAMLWATRGRSTASPVESGSAAPALQDRVPRSQLSLALITALIMACGLALGGFASPALAKTIVVTTLNDIADPPFDADGACGAGTISDLPGADGLISLREAIIAANNAKGKQAVTFDPSLSGGTIEVNFDDLDADTNPDPLPALCGGQTFIQGDLDGDDMPDITLEGNVFPAAPPFAAGLLVLSSHNTIMGLHVQHFPLGIRVLAGDTTNPGTVTHTTVMHNILAEAKVDGIFVATGNIPGSRVAHTTITQNLLLQNARNGILVVATLSVGGVGADTTITHTTLTDNEVKGSGQIGIFVFSLGDRNVVSDTTIARNTVSGSTFFGINVNGGFGGADGNSLDFRIKDNAVTDNGQVGIRVIAGLDNSSNNRVEARIAGNSLARNQLYGIAAAAGEGAASFPTGISDNNVLDVRIERNTVEDQIGVGIGVGVGVGSPNGRAGAIADHNQATVIVRHNTVVGSTVGGIELNAGAFGLASANSAEVWVAHNTVCDNTGTDIRVEGGFTGNVIFPVPNMGTGNVLEGEIFKNTATTVTVQNGTPGNTAAVTQSHNDPCP